MTLQCIGKSGPVVAVHINKKGKSCPLLFDSHQMFMLNEYCPGDTHLAYTRVNGDSALHLDDVFVNANALKMVKDMALLPQEESDHQPLCVLMHSYDGDDSVEDFHLIGDIYLNNCANRTHWNAASFGKARQTADEILPIYIQSYTDALGNDQANFIKDFELLMQQISLSTQNNKTISKHEGTLD